MKEKIELILQHGWGFDASAWEGWRTHLNDNADYDLVVHRAERGYFGKRKFDPTFSARPGRKVAIAHSTGLHFLPPEVLSRADLLVIISSFVSFHSGDSLEQRRSRRTFRLMLEKLELNPLEVLDDFYSNCYYPLLTRQVLLRRNADLVKLDQLSLYNDLQVVDDCLLDPAAPSAAGQVLILHGDRDKVVSSSQAVALQKLLPRSFLIMYEGVGHALPFTHVAPCWLSVRNALRSVLPVGSI
jgi:pimeloyl-ACP methyl ester carboxylesterase